MKKLALKIDDLAVESFCAAERRDHRMTVRAHILETEHDPTCMMQRVTGPCECVLTYQGDEPDRC